VCVCVCVREREREREKENVCVLRVRTLSNMQARKQGIKEARKDASQQPSIIRVSVRAYLRT
jgi:hypothetical protein